MRISNAEHRTTNRFRAWFTAAFLASAMSGSAADAASTNVHIIDLPTALRLAGAQNLEVQLAAEKSVLALAEYAQARQQMFPWLALGTSIRRHEGNAQTVEGNIIDADKSALDAGLGLKAQVDLGESWYRTLAAKQMSDAAASLSEARRLDMIHRVALGYFELVRARAVAEVSGESVRLATEYARQVREAVEAGLAFRGDAFRAEAQTEQNRLSERQARELSRLAAVRLATLLRLDPAVDLAPVDAVPLPLSVVEPDQELGWYLAQSLARRVELHGSVARQEAARIERDAARYAPLVPTLGAGASWGTLGGGRDGRLAEFDGSGDFGIGLSWRIGPGGLFDRARRRAADSRKRTAILEGEQVRDEVLRQVVESHARFRSLGEQREIARKAVESSEQTLKLSRERREFGVGAVAETLQAEQELTRARRDYLTVLAEYNKAQYSLRHAAGLGEASPAP